MSPDELEEYVRWREGGYAKNSSWICGDIDDEAAKMICIYSYKSPTIVLGIEGCSIKITQSSPTSTGSGYSGSMN
jgi:hypothetical protein